MAATTGNKFWLARASSGRDKLFETPESLWAASCEYFEWVEQNPLMSKKVVQYQGVPVDLPEPKMRAMTISGLCLFLDISHETWRLYKNRKDFIAIIETIENVIWNQKFSGASADLLNANIISRELGLIDKQETKNTISFEDMTDEELDAQIKARTPKQ